MNKAQGQTKSVVEIFLRYLSRTRPGLLFLHLIWLIVASCALSTSYIVAFHFTSLLRIYEEAHSVRNFGQNLRTSAKIDGDINTRLQELLEGTSANRAYVFRYHNGLAAVNGVQFFFQTLTHEVISPGTPRVMQYERQIPAGMNMAMSAEFLQNRCGQVQKTDGDTNSQNYWFYQSRGAKSLIRCPIYMPNGDLFGFVGIDFLNEVPPARMPAAVARVRESAKAIALIFSPRH